MTHRRIEVMLTADTAAHAQDIADACAGGNVSRWIALLVDMAVSGCAYDYAVQRDVEMMRRFKAGKDSREKPVDANGGSK